MLVRLTANFKESVRASGWWLVVNLSSVAPACSPGQHEENPASGDTADTNTATKLSSLSECLQGSECFMCTEWKTL